MRQTGQIERLGRIEHIEQMGQPEGIQQIEEKQYKTTTTNETSKPKRVELIAQRGPTRQTEQIYHKEKIKLKRQIDRTAQTEHVETKRQTRQIEQIEHIERLGKWDK